MPPQPLRPKSGTGRTDRQYFGMGGGIMQSAGLVACTGNDLATGCDDHGTHRDFIACTRCARFLQCNVHE